MNRVEQTFTIASGEIIIDNLQETERTDRLIADFVKNFVEIVSLDGAGDPIEPTAGDYEVYAQLVRQGNYRSLEDGGTIDATTTGGEATADGAGTSSSFIGNPVAIKVVAVDVVGAVSARVTVSQNFQM